VIAHGRVKSGDVEVRVEPSAVQGRVACRSASVSEVSRAQRMSGRTPGDEATVRIPSVRAAIRASNLPAEGVGA